MSGPPGNLTLPTGSKWDMNFACINSSKERRGPLVGPCSSIGSGHAFWAEELKYLREGLWPRDMDDRWAVWLDSGTLRHWRPQTQVAIGEDGRGTVVCESDVGS